MKKIILGSKNIVTQNGYIKFSEDDDEIIIDMVEVYQKRLGTGSTLVNAVIDYARENGYSTVSLCAYPQDNSIDLDSLVGFYKRLGFYIDYDSGSEVIMSYQI